MSYDSIKPARILIAFIKSFGIWNFKWHILNPLYKFYGWSLHSTFTFLFILGMYINVATTDTIDEFADALYMSLTETVLIVKVVNILSRTSQKIVDFLAIIEESVDTRPRNEKELKLLQERQGSFLKLRNVYISSCVIVLVISNVSSLVGEGYRLPFPCWMPFEYRNAKNFLYAYSYVAVSITISAMTNMTIDLLQAYLLFQLASFYKLIALRLESYGQPEDIEDLKRIMRFHNFVERMVIRCQNIISVPVFAQVIMSAFILCFNIYQVQKISLINDTANFIALLLLAIIMALQIYFPCYYGNEVTISADELTGAVYNSNWVGLSKESRKLIFIYMEGVKKPIQIKAGQFFNVGLKVFTKTINNAYSLLALLLNIND